MVTREMVTTSALDPGINLMTPAPPGIPAALIVVFAANAPVMMRLLLIRSGKVSPLPTL
jgi:hypothetical protein